MTSRSPRCSLRRIITPWFGGGLRLWIQLTTGTEVSLVYFYTKLKLRSLNEFHTLVNLLYEETLFIIPKHTLLFCTFANVYTTWMWNWCDWMVIVPWKCCLYLVIYCCYLLPNICLENSKAEVAIMVLVVLFFRRKRSSYLYFMLSRAIRITKKP